MKGIRIMVGDVFGRLAELPDESVHCVVTSPPYWDLRAYGGDGAAAHPRGRDAVH